MESAGALEEAMAASNESLDKALVALSFTGANTGMVLGHWVVVVGG